MNRARIALGFRCLLIVLMSLGCASSSDSPSGEADLDVGDGSAQSDTVGVEPSGVGDSASPDTPSDGSASAPDTEVDATDTGIDATDTEPGRDSTLPEPDGRHETNRDTIDSDGRERDSEPSDIRTPDSADDTTVDASRPDGEQDDGAVDAVESDAQPPDAGEPDTSPGSGCDCEDYASCTVDSCVDGVCTHTPDDALCPEGGLCAGASGHGLTGCIADGASFSVSALGCDSPDAEIICELTEASAIDGYEAFLGDETYVRCDYGLAMLQATLEEPGLAFADVIPVSMQGRFAFDGGKLELAGLWSDLCVGDTCYPIPVTPFVYPGADSPTPGQLLSTGHQVQITPNSAEEWNAAASALLLITNLSAPSTFLTSTVWSEGAPSDGSVVFTAWFRVKSPLSAAAPARVCIGESFFSNGAAESLDTFLAPEFGHVVVGP